MDGRRIISKEYLISSSVPDVSRSQYSIIRKQITWVKTCKRFKQTFHQRRYTDSKQENEKCSTSWVSRKIAIKT